MPTYLILDTESSVRLDDRRRVLVSLAYEVLSAAAAEGDDAADTGNPRGRILAAGYDIVHQSPDRPLDAESLRVHRIDGPTSRNTGKPLRTVLSDLAGVVRSYAPTAVVGHDVRGDVTLLVSECLRVRMDPRRHFGELFTRLVCTKLAATVPCGIPLPPHLCYRFPCDPHLLRLNGAGDDGSPRGGRQARGVIRLKWPNLAESFDHLVSSAPGATDAPGGGGGGGLRYDCHDARGDVERCRAVFLSLLLLRRAAAAAAAGQLMPRKTVMNSTSCCPE